MVKERQTTERWLIVVSVTHFSLVAQKKKEREKGKKSRKVVAALCVTTLRVVYVVKRTKQESCSSFFFFFFFSLLTLSKTMWESANTTTTNTIGYNSQISFYEYPPHKPFINSIYQPLRPSHTLSRTVALPESNRDQLLTALQSLSLRIKNLENEREVS